MVAKLDFSPTLSTNHPVQVVVGKKEFLSNEKLLPFVQGVDKAILDRMLCDASVGDAGVNVSTYAQLEGQITKIALSILPSKASRTNSSFQPHAISALVGTAVSTASARVLCLIEEEWQVGPIACALARSFPLFNMKQNRPSPSNESEQMICVEFVVAGETFTSVSNEARLRAAAVSAEGVRFAALLVDTPTQEMDSDALVAEARKVAAALAGVACEVIRGKELETRGYGGLWGVGKAAEKPPALVVLSWEPAGAAETVCLVGKGIVYDTGGLSIKTQGNMCSMKTDMGGAAALLAAFQAAVTLAYPHRLHAVLCVAENAVGPLAFRNDDILRLYSGKTVEINNTDAEGRLVLGDGVAHATRHLRPHLVLDMATLTGAQGVATGKRHAGLLANTAELEARAVAAGLRSGDLLHPLVYCPEFCMEEFRSKVADMKNSAANRCNALASCAGHFIEAHLDEGYTGGWLHVDMASPSARDERATGYGVALVLALLAVPGFA